MAKKSCNRGGGGISLGSRPQNNNMEDALESLLENSENNLLAESLERLMEKRVTDVEKNSLLEKAVDLGQRLQEAANRLTRQRSAEHNSLVWPLAHDLTVKVFSMLGTQTLCYAAATCKFFSKSAMDPACYADIDLTSGDFKIINDATILKMVQRAGLCFQSLRLGISGSADALDSPLLYKNYKEARGASMLTRSCLDILISENGMVGSLLKTLHLFNVYEIDNVALCTALYSCPSLCDLELVKLNVQLKSVLSCLSSRCHLLERLCFQSRKMVRMEGLRSHTCIQFLAGCPKISSLSLKGFKLNDEELDMLLKGFCNLKFVDFSTASNVTGTFLRSLVHTGNELQLEMLILRDCMHLKEVEVDTFIFALCAGECKYLQYLDISNKNGLAVADRFGRHTHPSVEGIAQLRSERPQFHLVAEFPDEKRQTSCSDTDFTPSSSSDSDESEALEWETPSSISMSDFSSESTDIGGSSSDAD